jgi:hypothetical protein
MFPAINAVKLRFKNISKIINYHTCTRSKSGLESGTKNRWNYFQESIGKGNYDADHWLSSSPVFALGGYGN